MTGSEEEFGEGGQWRTVEGRGRQYRAVEGSAQHYPVPQQRPLAVSGWAALGRVLQRRAVEGS